MNGGQSLQLFVVWLSHGLSGVKYKTIGKYCIKLLVSWTIKFLYHINKFLSPMEGFLLRKFALHITRFFFGNINVVTLS